MPAHRKRTPETDKAFFAAIASGESVCKAARVTGCSRQALYRRRIGDFIFDRRWREAEAAARDAKRKAKPRKRTGITIPITARRAGRPPISDGMLSARLKALLPHYREAKEDFCRQQHESSGVGPYRIVEGADTMAQWLRGLINEGRLLLEDLPEELRVFV